MIGSSDGKQYESEFDLAIGVPISAKREGEGAPRAARGSAAGTEGASEKATGASKGEGPTTPTPTIDRDHHVPLVASALTDKDGQMYGMAIDHRIPSKPEYEKHLWNHEAYENDYMNDLVKNGMSSKDAYHKAHDWSTARESAAVTAEFGEKGLEDYKQHWRDASSVAAEPTDKPRHPDAHTTKHGLDEAELGSSWQDKLMHVREAITGQKQPTKEELASGKVQIPSIQSALPQAVGMGMQAQGMAPALFGGLMAKTAGTAEKWWPGAEGKPRFEIPDINSKVKNIEHIGDSGVKLGDILDHKELFKAYPEFKDIKIEDVPEPYKEDIHAAHDPDSNTIWVRSDLSKEQMRSSLLHEIQHAIQHKEGFSPGTNPDAMKPYVKEALSKLGVTLPGKNLSLFQQALKQGSLHFYAKTAGEVESRNVETRRDFNDLDRYFRSPESTEDVPRYRQLNAPK